MSDRRDHVMVNRAKWDVDAAEYEEPGRRNWASNVPHWGIWDVPDSDVHMLPDVNGLDVIELGCGTAYVSSWLARLGGRVVGLDNSTAQLANARRFQREFRVEFPLIHGNAEAVPFADESFDVAVSEYGASLWCDPYRWIPEASRILRPGGTLVFLTNSALLVLCMPDLEVDLVTERLRRDYFGMHRFEGPDDPGIEFHLAHGDWIRLLRSNGFEVEDLVEVRAPEGATTRFPWVTAEWARRWPSEEIWKARKRPR
jgi:SAM-dependent methyltransferase